MTEEREECPGIVSDGDPAFDASVAHHARVYDYWLGGQDHFAADRRFAAAVDDVYPGIAATARANRAFLGRAIRFLAGEAGVSQFLDIGTGIPAPGGTHEVAREARPDSRIVYVDSDPVVLSHASALLAGHAPGAAAYLDADLRDCGHILQQSADTLDFGGPVGLLLIGILHAIPDADDPYRIVATLMNALPSGSYLAITHWASDPAPSRAEARIASLAREMSHQQYTARGEAGIARFFDGLDLVEPGTVRIQDWRPGPRDRADGSGAAVRGGVARKP